MSKRRLIKSNTAIDFIHGYMVLLLSVLILGGFFRKLEGISVSFDDTINPCSKEGYKSIIAVQRHLSDTAWVQSVTRCICLDLASRYEEFHFFYVNKINHSDEKRLADKGDEAIMVMGQWIPDVVIISDDYVREYIDNKTAQEGQLPGVFLRSNLEF